ncbi:MAG: hypothetical protein WB510_12985, partial [Candidatus Sulfotelmatobacter sp.]
LQAPGARVTGPLARVVARSTTARSPALNRDRSRGRTVQRQDPVGAAATATSGSNTVTTPLGPVTPTTYADLASVERLLTMLLEKDANQLSEADPARVTATDLITQARSAEPFLLSKGDAPLDQPAIDQANLWWQAFQAAGKGVSDTLKAAAVAAHDAQDKSWGDTSDALLTIPDSVADIQRAAFIKKDDDTLEKIQKVTGASLQAISAILDARTMSNFMLTKLTSEPGLPGGAFEESIIEGAEPYLEAAHAALAAVELVESTIRFLNPEGATDIDKQMAQANAALEAAPAAAGLLAVTGYVPGMGLYAVYISQMVSVVKAVNQFVTDYVRENGHTMNTVYLSSGELEKVDWSVEPGGKEGYDFMVLVMKAGSYTDIPKSMPDAVDEAIMGGRNALAAGTGVEVPTQSNWIFWKKLNPDKIRQWLFNGRRYIWNMFYGSVTPPG